MQFAKPLAIYRHVPVCRNISEHHLTAVLNAPATANVQIIWHVLTISVLILVLELAVLWLNAELLAIHRIVFAHKDMWVIHLFSALFNPIPSLFSSPAHRHPVVVMPFVRNETTPHHVFVHPDILGIHTKDAGPNVQLTQIVLLIEYVNRTNVGILVQELAELMPNAKRLITLQCVFAYMVSREILSRIVYQFQVSVVKNNIIS